MDIILETKDLTKTYKAGGNHINAVDHTSICVERGDFVTIVGKSGSGKSTLLHLIGGLDYPTSGEVWIDNESIRMLGDPTTTLCQCLWFLMEKRKWLYPETFNEKTLLHKNYHGKIKNNKYNNMKTNVLMPICVGLKLVLRLTEKVFDKSDNKLNYYNDPDKSYIRIMEFMPGLSIQDFNTILEKQGLAPLGTVSKDEK